MNGKNAPTGGWPVQAFGELISLRSSMWTRKIAAPMLLCSSKRSVRVPLRAAMRSVPARRLPRKSRPVIAKLDLKALEDDRHAFPPYQVCILARQDLLRDTPGLRDALGELAGRFSNERMRELNYLVDGEHLSVTQVASDFLKQEGL